MRQSSLRFSELGGGGARLKLCAEFGSRSSTLVDLPSNPTHRCVRSRYPAPLINLSQATHESKGQS